MIVLLFKLSLTLARQVQIGLWSLLGLLDDAVERDEAILGETKKHPRNPIAGKIATHFPKPIA